MNKWIFLLIYFVALIWSAIAPHDYFTWILEVFPALIGFGILVLSYKKFPLTNLVYTLILMHCIILFVGGHYTYAEVPMFDWIKDSLGQERNNYDKVGHIAQGFIPAMVIREVFIRKEIIKKGIWLFIIIVFFCLGISALYELIEWMVAELSGQGADAFLGTQGYIWDTQSDMFCALIGSISSQLLFAPWHNKQIEKLKVSV